MDSHDQIREYVRKSTKAQGLPEKITDPDILMKVAAMMRPATTVRAGPAPTIALRQFAPDNRPEPPVQRDRLGGMSETAPQCWTAKHFSQANPKGPGQGDVPALLRRAADTIEHLGEVDVVDLIMHTEVTEDGDWHNLTVYFVDEERGQA
jgi:hypothetical protein